MHVRWLQVSAFRNYASLSFAPDPGLNVLTGDNGQGKTSLLEALHLLLTGRSFRTARLPECIAWGAPAAVIAGEVEQGMQRREMRLTLAGRGGLVMTGGPAPWASVVRFTAADVALLGAGPAVRRAYLDGATAKLMPAHAESCRRYRLVLQQRNALLARLAGRADAGTLLEPWDQQVAELGAEIVHRRLAALAVLRQDAGEVWRILAAGNVGLALEYAPSVEVGDDAAATAGQLRAALGGGRRAELARGVTLAGPHRDDVVVRLGGADARAYASRGEQRLLALTLRLTEAAAIRRRTGAAPVLLLDDLLSDLDARARERVLTWLGGQGQVLFSTTDAVPAAAAPAAAWEVRQGEVEALESLVVGGAA